MLYRQKILLSLIEVFGGNLTKTDLMKLLFLFCKDRGVDHYEFFPYQYGAFSFMSYYDKRKLIQRNLLVDTDRFIISSPKSFITSLRTDDQIALRKFVETVGDLRGRDLIHKTYLEYPKYATRSEIAVELLSTDELRRVQSERIKIQAEGLFTIGYEGITIDGYLDRLLKRDIQLVIDVRKNPISRKYGFSRRQLQEYLTKVEISYIHEPSLGVASHLRKSSQVPQDYSTLFEHYSQVILPDNKPVIDKIIEATKKHKRVALTCFEADPQMCHRHKITEEIEALPSNCIQIFHI